MSEKETTAIVAVKRPSALSRMAERLQVDPNRLLDTLKATVFKAAQTNEQLISLLIVANEYHLNPITKEIYAFPDKVGGVVPVVGVDGWARIVNEHPAFDGIEFAESSDGAAVTCTIYRKDRSHPTKVTEYLAECKRNTDPWRTHPKRMLRHKAMIQAARLAFGFAGIYDPDEAVTIIDGEPTDANPPKETQVIAPAASKLRQKLLGGASESASGGVVEAAPVEVAAE